MGDLAQRGNRLTFAKGGRVARPKSRDSKTHAKDVPTMAAQGGRIGKAVGGWTLKRPVQKLLEGIGGGSEKKPHSTRAGRIAAGVRKIKRGTKKWLKDEKPRPYLGRPFMKIKKEKDWADPKETVGGRRIQTKGGPELIPPKRKDDVGVGGYQEPLKNRTERPLGVGGRRIGLKKGKMPWGTGPKPGSHEFLMQNLHKRKGKAIGGSMIKKVTSKLRPGVFKPKKKVYPETEDLTHQVGPYAGDVGSEGKRRRLGPRVGKGKSPGRPKGAGQKGRRPWRGTPPGRPRPPAPKYGPGPYIPDPRRKYPKGKYQKPFQPGQPPERIHPKGRYQKPEQGQPQSKPQPLKKGGKADKKWIQKAVDPKHKGYCTPMTKKTCTPARKALARTFKKKAKTGW